MKSKIIDTYREKAKQELEKDRVQLIKKITLLQLALKINPPKDTTALSKKRRALAILQTVVQEKKAQGVEKQK